MTHAATEAPLADRGAVGAEALDALPRRVGVGDVVVREFLALQLRPAGEQAACHARLAIEGRALVRVLAVAHVLRLDELQVEHRGVLRARRHVRARVLGAGIERGQVIGDHAVVGGGVSEDLLRQRELGCALHATGFQLCEHLRVVGRLDHHRHVLPVLRRRAQHRRAADVDVLDRIVERAVGLGRGLRKRVEVDDEQIDRADAVFFQRRHVRGIVAPRQQAAVDARVQRLHAAVEHFREAGDCADFGHRQVVLRQQLCGAAGGQQLHAGLVQRAREIDDAGFVGDGEQCGGHLINL